MLSIGEVCRGIIGLDEDEAVAIIRGQGYKVRVERRDDIPYCVRRTSDKMRINLHIANGLVTLASWY